MSQCVQVQFPLPVLYTFSSVFDIIFIKGKIILLFKYFLRAYQCFRKVLRRFSKNIGERFEILFQEGYERLKYRKIETKRIWKSVKLTKEQKREIDEFFKQNYGKRIPYTYHRLYTAYTGNFDKKYIPNMLYAPYLERFLTDLSYGNVFTNKNTLSILARGLNVKMPENIVMCNKNGYYDKYFNRITLSEVERLLQDAGKVFIKKTTESFGGRGCTIANFLNGIDINTNLPVSKLVCSLGDNFCIQELIVCHESIRKIYPHSVNTFRVITYILEGEVYHCPVILRLGLGGSFTDNASAGGIFIAVDEDGVLHKSAFTEYRKEFTSHPDTNLVFEGHKIEHLNKVIELAERLQLAIPQVGIINWDFTINEEGHPILVEANMRNDVQVGSVWLPQMAHGKGPFGDNTAKILQYIRQGKKKSYSKRRDFTM